jgi:hypothetical protein
LRHPRRYKSLAEKRKAATDLRAYGKKYSEAEARTYGRKIPHTLAHALLALLNLALVALSLVALALLAIDHALAIPLDALVPKVPLLALPVV